MSELKIKNNNTLYKWNYFLVFLFIIIRSIETIITFLALELSNVREVGLVAQKSIFYTQIIVFILISIIIYLNYIYQNNHEKLEYIKVFLYTLIIGLTIITVWNIYQYTLAI